MPNMSEIVHRRRERRAERRRINESRVRAALLGFGYLFSIALAIAIFASVFAYADLTRDLPSIEQLPILLDPQNGLLLQPTRVYDRTGEQVIFTFAPSDAKRVYVPFVSIPQPLVDATIAASDPRFDSHPGYLLSGLDNPDSHPTLAQKLAYDLLLFVEPPSLRRALRERILAAQITSRFGKNQVIEWTLNSTNYGHYAFGIQSASELYFDKSATELTLAESALLASVAETPSLNPLDAPEAASQRAKETLLIMQALGMIEEIPSLPSPTGRGDGGEGREGAFINLALSQLATRYDRQRIERGGLKIISTLDTDLQTSAACLTKIFAARLVNAPADESNCDAARYLSALPQTNLAAPSASALILDPRDGQILALIGETDAQGESAFLTAHNPGALLTPFVYLTGFARGLAPASLVWDIPRGDLQNPDLAFHGPMRLRVALANDYLAPALDVLDQMGADNATRTARSFGLDISLPSDLEPGAAFVSASPPQTLLDLSAAYATFSSLGLRNGQSFADTIQPSSVLRLETVDGAIWLDWSQPESQSVVSPQLAYLMNHALSDASARWPGWGNPNVTEIGRPAAFKSGWTGSSDAWAIGYTPARLVAVWNGDSGTEFALSPRLPASLWAALMQAAHESLPADSWTPPAGIIEMDVCDPSGLLPTSDCPEVVREVFASGFEPTQGDTLFRSAIVNRETGLLATVFTPPALTEERVFMAVPEEARAWADASGIPVAPEAYDAIQPPAQNPNVNIGAPALFADVNGRVEIVGTATGDGFQYYKILVGKGLNPREWRQVGENFSTPIINGELAEWDAAGLDGLYAIQLVVVYADQRVETAVVLVAVGD
ncbi:MAG: transglycosylase domain-containing protein [Chloroflexi bacterium]|nr:transglycosylase domain-containing protein [Chloroflexota bacterium]